MKTTFLLCLALAGDSISGIILQQHRPTRDSSAHQYELLVQEMARHRYSSESHETSESTSDMSNWKWNEKTANQISADVRSEKMYENMFAVQEALTNPGNNQNKDPEHVFEDAYEIMQHFTEEDKKKIQEGLATWQSNDDDQQNATQLLQKNNYDVEQHTVKTDDGYYLTLIRVQQKQQSRENTPRPVALLVHGLLGSADDWVLMGPRKSLAYQMADAGFDVWLGNVRGSKYSQHHASKHPGQPDFWRFSIDEIAAHDLPAMIDHVLGVTQEPKLYYVGHNHGTTAFFAMASAYPEYREKVAMMHALSPMVYMTNVRSPLFRMVSPKSRYSKSITHQLGHAEFKLNKNLIHNIGGKMCEKVIRNVQVCSNANFVISGLDTAGTDKDVMHMITKHQPGGASTRQIKQYGQVKAAEQFRKYDYGSEVNMIVYGQRRPPQYNMSDVQVPVALYYSEEDLLAHPADVERLYKELPDVRDYYKVSEKHFSNMDFQFSSKAPTVVNEKVIEQIANHHNSLYNPVVRRFILWPALQL